MTRIQSFILSPDNQEIPCEYFEVESVFRNLIENNPNLLDDFKEFSRNYTYFNSYMDYAMFKLGYKIKNPLNLEKAILEAKENAIFLTQFSQSFEIFPKSDDVSIGLFKMRPENIEIAMVDENLNGIKPAYYGHERMSRFILNHIFMKDSNLYIKYIEELNEEETSALFFDHVNFLIKNSSFLRVEKIVVTDKLRQFHMFKDRDVSYEIIGCEWMISENQKELMEECLAKGILRDIDVHIIPDIERKKAV